MSRKSIYLGLQKKSEYRQNFLPFDYYDFCITAKENENLRCRNKLRDYLHTPFDWDEDLDIYIEPLSDNLNQSTQTLQKPATSRHQTPRAPSRQNEMTYQDYVQESERFLRDRNGDNVSCEIVEKKFKKNKKKANKANVKKNIKQEPKEQECHIDEDDYHKNGIHVNAHRENAPRPAPKIKRTQSTFVKSSMKKHQEPNVAREIQAKKVGNFESLRNNSNMSVQTPADWTLRNYHSKPPAKGLYRSASAVSVSQKQNRNGQAIKPPPFAMYGSGVKTKDMSLKPTHNTLANKTLAKHQDKDAMIELALQKLKKEANVMANEYSIVESAAAEKHRTGRSESRGWNSEYEDRYPDHSRSASRNELYYKENPYRMHKSTLNVDYPMVKRGPSAGKKKIFFYE